MVEKIKRRNRKYSDDDIDYTNHAKKRLNERGISKEKINIIMEHGKRKIFGNRVIYYYRGYKLIINNKENIVITVYKES